MPTRKANAVWEGGLKGGHGKFGSESGVIGGSYTFGTRFENSPGTNPEELLAAAEAACFSMALSADLEKVGKTPTSVATEAFCTIEKVDAGMKVTTMKLVTRVTAPGLSQGELVTIAEQTKIGCPVSGALRGNVKIELDIKLG